MEFDRERCVWKKTKAETENILSPTDPLLEKISEFMNQHRETWTGSASELLLLLPDISVQANVLTRKLNVKAGRLYKDYGILYEPKPRTPEKKEFTLTLIDSAERTVNEKAEN